MIRGYVAPSCILHGIFCFIIHYNPHDAYTSAHYTHAHACIDATRQHAFTAALHCIIIYLLMLYYRLLTCIRTFISSTYAHIHTYMQAYTRTGTHMQHEISSGLIRCSDEPHACIFLHQMLAPSHRAQVLF